VAGDRQGQVLSPVASRSRRWCQIRSVLQVMRSYLEGISVPLRLQLSGMAGSICSAEETTGCDRRAKMGQKGSAEVGLLIMVVGALARTGRINAAPAITRCCCLEKLEVKRYVGGVEFVGS
jgi:hypothetical protein